MDHRHPSLPLYALVAGGMLLSACGTTAPNDAAKDAPQGRKETGVLPAASAVGYDGDALRKSVDDALNANDKHVKETEDAMKQEGGTDKK